MLQKLIIPAAGTYPFTAALFDKDFKVGSHHMVYEVKNRRPPKKNDKSLYLKLVCC